MLLFALACTTPDPAFSLQLRNKRSFDEFALAVGARTTVVLHPERRREPSQDPVRFDEVAFTVSDGDVLALDGTTLVAKAAGDVELTATATVDGYRSSDTVRIEVRPVASRVWTLAGGQTDPDSKPLTEVAVLQDDEVMFAVQHLAADGQRLVSDGLSVLSEPHPYARPEPSTPETSMLRFASPQLGTFELARMGHATPMTVRVVDTWSSVRVSGDRVRLELADGALLHFREPGPKLLSLTRGCTVPDRATGTNPFRVALSIVEKDAPDDLEHCRVRLRVAGRPVEVEIPIAAADRQR
jgi:hypothetical protein